MVFKKNNFVFSQVFQDRLHMNTKVLLQCLEQSKNPAKTLGIRSRYILGFFPAIPTQNYGLPVWYIWVYLSVMKWSSSAAETEWVLPCICYTLTGLLKKKKIISCFWVIFFIIAYSANVFGYLLPGITRFSPFYSDHLQNLTRHMHSGSCWWCIFQYLFHLIKLISTFLYRNQWGIWLNWSFLINMHTRSTVCFC